MTSTDTAAPRGGQAERIPISFNQEFVCMFDHGDEEGLFGPRNHIVHGWRVRGALDTATLRAALDDLVERHPMLRTQIIRDEVDPFQRVWPPNSPPLTELDCTGIPPEQRHQRIEELLNDVESGTVPITELPHLRAVVARFDTDDSLLVLIVHHIATDGWSMRLLIRDLAACYAARRGVGPRLAEVPSYQEYARRQRGAAEDDRLAQARTFWQEKLDGARMFTFTGDHPRSQMTETTSGVYRFGIEEQVNRRVSVLAGATRSTPFMVFLAAYLLFIRQLKGETDIVVPTFTPGRGEEAFHRTVGSFFNFLPLRIDIARCQTFREVIRATRTTCLESYQHDIPTMQIFEHAPQLMDSTEVDDQAPFVFQVFPFPFVLDGELVGDLAYAEVRRRFVSQPLGSDVPDGALWTLNLDPAGDIVGSVHYKSGMFAESTIADLVARFTRVLRAVVAAPDEPLTAVLTG